ERRAGIRLEARGLQYLRPPNSEPILSVARCCQMGACDHGTVDRPLRSPLTAASYWRSPAMNALRAVALSLAMGLVPATAAAQEEVSLRREFEGATVRLLIDMPGAVEGVDLSPQAQLPFDYDRYRSRIGK